MGRTNVKRRKPAEQAPKAPRRSRAKKVEGSTSRARNSIPKTKLNISAKTRHTAARGVVYGGACASPAVEEMLAVMTAEDTKEGLMATASMFGPVPGAVMQKPVCERVRHGVTVFLWSVVSVQAALVRKPKRRGIY